MGTKDACDPIYPNGTSIFGNTQAGATGCSLGALSPYVVNATEAGHVQAALEFAEDHNLRLNIKNTGHGGKLRYERPLWFSLRFQNSSQKLHVEVQLRVACRT